jgi:hypothetical protein
LIQLSRRTTRLAVVALVALACSCGDDTGLGGASQGGGGGTPAQTGGGGQAQIGGNGTGGAPATTTGGMGGGDGGAGGEVMPAPPGPPGNALVSAGDRVSSPSYTLVFTMGQSTINQTKTTSSNYRLHGGLIGATGSLP